MLVETLPCMSILTNRSSRSPGKVSSIQMRSLGSTYRQACRSVEAVEGEDTNVYSFKPFLTFSEDGIRDQMHSLGVRG